MCSVSAPTSARAVLVWSRSILDCAEPGESLKGEKACGDSAGNCLFWKLCRLGGPSEEPRPALPDWVAALVPFLWGISRGISALPQEKGADGIRLEWNLSQSSL